MPALIDSGPTDVNCFVDYLYGKESHANASIAAVATHVHHQVQRRPAVGGEARWSNISTMKHMVQHVGPSATAAQFDAALAAYVAS